MDTARLAVDVRQRRPKSRARTVRLALRAAAAARPQTKRSRLYRAAVPPGLRTGTGGERRRIP
jgi:hypothetical protein